MSGSRKGGGKGGARGGRQPARPAAKKPAAKETQRKPAGSSAGPPVVGKRPSKPSFLALIALLWFAAAVVAFFGIHRGWRLIPVVAFAGVGLFYLRGAAGSYLRRPGAEPKK